MQALRSQPSVWPEPEIMEVAGYLDSNTASQVEEDVMLCIQSGAREMILDCRKLSYITGAGLRAILTMTRAMKAVEGRFAISGMQPQVRAMLEACGYDRIVPVCGSLEEAIAVVTA